MIICFEGVDKTGKSTLHKAFDKLMNYRYLTVDRLYATYLAYSIRYDRPVELAMITEENIEGCIIIYVDCDNREISRRIQLENEPPIDIEKDKACFDIALNILSHSYGAEIIRVDTTLSPVEECALYIRDTIKELLCEHE